MNRNYSECLKNFKSFQHKINVNNIEGVSGGIVNILGGGSMDYSE
jgi:hypothetical protein